MPSKRKIQGFARRAADATSGDWGQIRGYNNALKRLAKRRVKKLARTGNFEISQIAMQVAALQHALLHRIVSLGTAITRNWNAGNVLGAALGARALLETIALIHRVEDELFSFAEKKDFEGLQKHAVKLIFANRDDELNAQNPELQATNALTYVQHFDKAVPGIEKHYKFLCEWCHPNHFGHYGAFAKFDKEANSFLFCEQKMHGPEMLDAILAVYSMLNPLEETMDRWDKTILKASQVRSEPTPPPSPQKDAAG